MSAQGDPLALYMADLYDSSRLYGSDHSKDSVYEKFDITRRILDLCRIVAEITPVTQGYINACVDESIFDGILGRIFFREYGTEVLEEHLFYHLLLEFKEAELQFVADLLKYEIAQSRIAHILLSNNFSNGSEGVLRSEYDLENAYISLDIYYRCRATRTIYRNFSPGHKSLSISLERG